MAPAIAGKPDDRRVRLRVKLLLIALLTAVFPLAGWRFIQQMEDTLREGQEQALLASGRAISQAVLALEPGWATQASAPGRWYAHEVAGSFQMDGYDDDWKALNAPSQGLGDAGGLELDFRAAITNRWLESKSCSSSGAPSPSCWRPISSGVLEIPHQISAFPSQTLTSTFCTAKTSDF